MLQEKEPGMRNFTKLIFSFSWAMSLFGVQQAVNTFMPSKATEAFDNVTRAAKEQFDDVMKATFRSGDNMQRTMMDMMFGVFTGQAFHPSKLTRMASGMVQQSAEAVGQVMRAATSSRQRASAGSPRTEPAPEATAQQSYSPPPSQGWGTMPGSGCDESSVRS